MLPAREMFVYRPLRAQRVSQVPPTGTRLTADTGLVPRRTYQDTTDTILPSRG